MTIRAQVTLALCGMVVFSLAIGIGFSVLAVRESLDMSARRQHEHDARLLAALAAADAKPEALRPFMATLAAGPGVRYAFLAGEGGVVRLHTEPGLVGRRTSELGTPQAAGAERRSAKARSGERSFEGVVGVSPELQREFLRGALRELVPRFLPIAGLGLAAGALIAWGLGLYLVKPIQELAEASRRVGRGDLSAQIADPPPNELGELARQFNAMTGTLRALETLREERMSHVSHDVRSPLAAVEMLVDYLLTQDPDRERLTGDQRRKLQTIQDSCRRLRVFAANVLDAAKIQAGRMEYRRVPVEADAAARRVVALFEVLARLKGVELSCDVEPELRLLGDPDRFDQVLANLVSNSLKYTNEDGKVVVRGRRLERRALLEVRDTGAGMTPEQQARLFKAFESGPGPEGEALPSAGLGLFVVKESVSGMGGRISVESEPGKGTRFIIELEAA